MLDRDDDIIFDADENTNGGEDDEEQTLGEHIAEVSEGVALTLIGELKGHAELKDGWDSLPSVDQTALLHTWAAYIHDAIADHIDAGDTDGILASLVYADGEPALSKPVYLPALPIIGDTIEIGPHRSFVFLVRSKRSFVCESADDEVVDCINVKVEVERIA